MKPRRPQESELGAAAGARLIVGCARPCLEARSYELLDAQPGVSTVLQPSDVRLVVRTRTIMRHLIFRDLLVFTGVVMVS